ncbi:unnamed protein product [Arabidopsis halleri]
MVAWVEDIENSPSAGSNWILELSQNHYNNTTHLYWNSYKAVNTL